MSRIPLAWLQLKRERLRFLVGIAGVTFAVVLIFMQLGFQEALFESGVRFHKSLLGDLMLISPKSEVLYRMLPFPRRRLYQAAEFPGVASVSAVYTNIGLWRHPSSPSTRGIFVAAFDPDEDVLDVAEVKRQRDVIRYPDRALFDELARPEFAAVIASWRETRSTFTEVDYRRVEIAGLFPLGTSFGVDATLVTSDLNFLRMFPHRPPGLIDIGLIRLAPGTDAAGVQRAMIAALGNDVEVLTKQQYLDRESAFWAVKTPIGYVFTFGTVMGLIVGSIIVYQILFADIASHLPEYATLKAMGYTNRYLFSVVLEEALILAVCGFVPGFLICWQLYALTAQATQLPLHLGVGLAASVFALTLFMCCLSGAMALQKVRRADPASIF